MFWKVYMRKYDTFGKSKKIDESFFDVVFLLPQGSSLNLDSCLLSPK